MKTQIIIFLSLIIFAAFSQPNPSSMGNDGIAPRGPQSCDGTKFGYFWDNQKCEECYNTYCKCNAWMGCDSCLDGFFMTKTGTASNTNYKLAKDSCKVCDGNSNNAFPV